MRNERTLLERVVLSKAIEGELRTFDIDLHDLGERFEVYVYDPEEAFEAEPVSCSSLVEAKRVFTRFMELIVVEPVHATDSPFDFAERVYGKLFESES
ncbi:MAG: hypothetical protein ACYCVB_06330 [Bacilli bacterium]